MTETDGTIFTLRLLQVLLAVPLLSIVGQGIVWVLARAMGQEPANNVFYRVLAIVPLPFNKLARLITPRFVPDARIPLVSLCLLVVGYVATMLAIAQACHARGLPVGACLERRA
jgi:hypothetical protein